MAPMIVPQSHLLTGDWSGDRKEMVNGIQPRLDCEIVDEARVAHYSSGDQAHFARRLIQRLESGGVDQRQIVDPQEPRVDPRLLAVAECGGGLPPPPERGARGEERPWERGTALPR